VLASCGEPLTAGATVVTGAAVGAVTLGAKYGSAASVLKAFKDVVEVVIW